MTDQEFTQFATALFSAFPHISAWIKTNSPDPLATQAAWRQTLRKCNYDECLSIVNEWIEGKQQPPTPYETHMTALIIRARVMNERDKEMKLEVKRKDLEAYTDKQKEIQERRNSYVRLTEVTGMLGVGVACKIGIDIKNEFLKGKMTEAEYKRRIDQLIESVA